MVLTDTFKKIKTTNSLNLLIIALFLAGCSTLKIATDNTKHESISVYLGGSQGGFIENSDIDAISGATNTSENETEDPGTNFFAGIHWQYPVNKRGSLEIGVDFISHQQCLIYHDPSMGYDGKLNLDYYRISMPLTYNFGFIRNRYNNPILNFKIGFALNYIHEKQAKVLGVVPNFSMNNFAVSPYFGLSIVPLSFKRYSLGVFFNSSILKGTKVFYDNTYHKKNSSGLLSTMELGFYFNFEL